MGWNPDYKAEFERRLRNKNKLVADPKVRALILAHYTNCPIDWINDWCVTFDPRNTAPTPRLLPFMLFPRQEEFVLFLKSCLDDKESGLVEKARDMGATWLCCAFSVWLWLFRPGTVVGWGVTQGRIRRQAGRSQGDLPKVKANTRIPPVLDAAIGIQPFDPCHLHADRQPGQW
jgi:phage terminase large subunit